MIEGLWVLFMVVLTLAAFWPTEVQPRWRRWRTARGRAACAAGKHRWVERVPTDIFEAMLPYSKCVRCSRCNVRARLITSM